MVPPLATAIGTAVSSGGAEIVSSGGTASAASFHLSQDSGTGTIVTDPPTSPYVCIAAQSTTQAKYWNNPDGWRMIVAFLKEAGYRVICIDQKPTHGTGLV
jgi:hypothetical protein